MGYSILYPYRGKDVRIPWSRSVNFSFPSPELVLSEIFQAILIENHSSIHHNVIGSDNSRLKGYFSGHFSKGHPLMVGFLNSPIQATS